MQRIIYFLIRNKDFILFLSLFTISLSININFNEYNKSKFLNSSNSLFSYLYDTKFTISKYKNTIQIRIKSRSFLQQQVRSMVGCLKYLGEERWNLKYFEKVFKSKKRSLCAPPAPANGLFLEKISY